MWHLCKSHYLLIDVIELVGQKYLYFFRQTSLPPPDLDNKNYIYKILT